MQPHSKHASLQIDDKSSGWWAKSDKAIENAEQDEEKKAKAAFSSQFGLTGQSGIGGSMFNIRESLLHALGSCMHSTHMHGKYADKANVGSFPRLQSVAA